MNSLNWKKVLISGVVFAVFVVMLAVGVYLVRKPQSQNVGSKATLTCNARWPADPTTACGTATQQPSQNATNVSLTPDFQWGYGGYRAGETGCVDPSGCDTYSASVYLFEGSDQNKALARANIPQSGGQTTPVKNAPFSQFVLCEYTTDPNTCHTDRQPTITTLKPSTTYYWTVTPFFNGTVHAEQTWNYRFTTGTGTPATPDCTSLTTTADLNNLQIGQLYTFSMTVSGPATSIVMPVYFDNSCTTLTNNTAPYRASGPGTYTTSWRPTRAGPFVAYGQVNAGTTSCQADCGGTLCAGAASCKLTGTVKTQIVACNQTCDATHLCPSSLSCDTVSGTCRNSACSTQTSCVCPVTVGCNQTCNTTTLLCSSQYDCTAGKCVSKVCPTTQDSSCACPIPAGSCQRVTASKDLSTIKIGDTVTFTGFGTLANPVASDSIDKINFIISKDGAEASNTEAITTLDSAGVWKATKDFSITSPGSYSVRIRAHWLSKNSWLE